MEHFNESISNLSWTLTTLPSEAKMFNSQDNSYYPIPDSILNYKLPYSNRPSHIELVTLGSTVVLTAPFKGKTFKEWLHSLYEGLHTPIDNDSISVNQRGSIYRLASYYVSREDRLQIIDKLEHSQLKPVELLGDRVFFEGHIIRRNNIWSYYLGS